MTDPVELSQLAREDLIGIWRSSHENWGSRIADDYLDAIGSAMERLARYPNSGRARPDLGPDYQCILVGKHLVYFRTMAHRVFVVRVLHASMDPTEQL